MTSNGYTAKWSANIPTFILFVFLLAAPCALSWSEDGSFHFAKLRFATGMAASFVIATILTMAASLHKSIKLALTAFVTLLSFAEFWIFFVLKTRLSVKVISLIMQTNCSEASEFITAYVLKWPTAIILICLCAAILLVVKGTKRIRCPFEHKAKIAFLFCNIISVATICTGIFSSRFNNQIAYPTIIQLIHSIHGYCSHAKDINILENTIAGATAKITADANPPANIIWIIGESYNKHHASAYGYRLPTTSRIDREHANGNITIFTDVTTPSASTDEVMEYVFSTHCPGDSLSWQKSQLLPVLFKKAGYKVSLHDNQTTMLAGDSKWDASNMYFFNSKTINDASFDYRNNSMSEFDLDFCEQELKHVPQGDHVFTIFHLMGQHSLASKRYPSGFDAFDSDNYEWRTDLNQSQKSELAHYDNATAYNDSVIGLIIDRFADKDAVIIYHPDHGEEIHDFRVQYGRTLEKVTPDIARCIYQIPMYIYTTPRFRQLHPELSGRIAEAAGKPFSIAFISHFLLQLANIETPSLKPRYSPIDTAYSAPILPPQDPSATDL